MQKQEHWLLALKKANCGRIKREPGRTELWKILLDKLVLFCLGRSKEKSCAVIRASDQRIRNILFYHVSIV